MDKVQYSNMLGGILSSGTVLMSMALGHKLGLFKQLCDADSPMTSSELAEKAKLKERYVREWLNGMAAAEILKLDPETGRYYLTSVQKEVLSQKSSFAPVLFMMAARAPFLMDCFRKDGPFGLQYEEDVPFFDWYSEHRSNITESILSEEVFPVFKSQGLTPELDTGIRVIDLGSGAGTFTLSLARRFPISKFVGVDFCHKAIEIANKTRQEQNLSNVEFQQGDAHNLPESWTETYDLVFVYDLLHDLPDPHKAISEIHRILKPDGCLAVLELTFSADPAKNVGDKQAAMSYSLSTFICLPCSLSGEPRVGYGGCWGKTEVEKALKNGRFNIISSHPAGTERSKTFYLCKKLFEGSES